MGNPARGEVGFEAGGQRYTLKFGVNALAELERSFGVRLREITPILSDPTVDQVVEVVRIGLRPSLTAEEVGDVLDEIGGIAGASELMREAFALAFPAGEAAAEAAETAERSTGSTSSPTTSPPVSIPTASGAARRAKSRRG